jgi:ribosomal protein S18 acetylase RimI-like enzyme
MRYGLVAENPLEWAVLASGIVPTPLIDAWAAAFSRALVAATDLGVFESLKDGPQPAAAVAQACGSDPRATEKLLNLLVSLRHLRERDDAYSLTKATRRWLLKDELCALEQPDDPLAGSGYIASLGVLRSYRGRGLGLALLRHGIATLFARGRRRVTLHVDSESLTGATRLYERAGMSVVRTSVAFERELRPGR